MARESVTLMNVAALRAELLLRRYQVDLMLPLLDIEAGEGAEAEEVEAAKDAAIAKLIVEADYSEAEAATFLTAADAYAAIVNASEEE